MTTVAKFLTAAKLLLTFKENGEIVGFFNTPFEFVSQMSGQPSKKTKGNCNPVEVSQNVFYI
jgi:hypothetical protein